MATKPARTIRYRGAKYVLAKNALQNHALDRLNALYASAEVEIENLQKTIDESASDEDIADLHDEQDWWVALQDHMYSTIRDLTSESKKRP